ncbi:MAG: hypothetical protein Q8O55_01330 [Dehalococcoidales bacterium]|nr:hypothetical protein [Dehalococcoidales bacterium]
MRNQGQRVVRQKRVKIANELILWIEDLPQTKGHLAFPVVEQFARERKETLFEVWEAWAILRAANRLNSDGRHGWELLNTTPIQVNANGDIIQG